MRHHGCVIAPLAPFRYPAFASYWFARVFWTLGTQVQITAMSWQVYDLARERGASMEEGAFLLGLIGLTQFLPLLLLFLIGGQAADRLNRKLIVLTGICLKILFVTGLLVATRFDAGAIIVTIFVVAGLTGALNAFLPAASQAMVSNLVPREEIPHAIALMSLGFQAGAIAGSAVGGLLYREGGTGLLAGAGLPYAVATGLFAAAALMVALTRAPVQTLAPGGRTLALIREGVVYVSRNKVVLGALSLDLGVVLLAGATALLPVFARDILQAGPDALGWLRAAAGLGAAVVALALALNPIRRHVGAWMFGSVIVFGLATMAFGMSRTIWLSVACLVVAGAADMISVFVRASLVQLATPDPMRGRVAAVSFMFISASNELGEFQSGLAARLIGPVLAVVLGGAGALAVAGLWMRLFPQLARADRYLEEMPPETVPDPAPDPAKNPAR